MIIIIIGKMKLQRNYEARADKARYELKAY